MWEKVPLLHPFGIEYAKQFWKNRKKNQMVEWVLIPLSCYKATQRLFNNFLLDRSQRSVYSVVVLWWREMHCLWVTPDAYLMLMLGGVIQGGGKCVSLGPVKLEVESAVTEPASPLVTFVDSTTSRQLEEPTLPHPSQITELLSKTIADAHARTCLYSLEHIHSMFRKPQDVTKIMYYKELPHEQLWLECAQKLTTVIQQIIEFAKMVPGFMKLTQDDQIVLLKAGSFELAILRMSRYYELSQDAVLCTDSLLPREAFFTTDQSEQKLVSLAFDVARGVAELKLTETELALYSAVVLLSPDRQGLKGLAEITRLGQACLRALRTELERNHTMPIKGDVTVCDALMNKIPTLRDLSMLHMEALAKFKRTTPHLEFPALHKELFSVDS
ncbi:hypothetical protein J6590_028614 [Homalodisca vitripennis]|nr:hypothetical protein J6590_028614 [Homalodisca vitripennis]